MAAKPVKHYGRWRIRWTDAIGKRRSETLDNYRDAELALHRQQLEAEEIRRGIRTPVQPDRTFAELAQQWMDHRAAHKRSGKGDQSILNRHLLPAFGERRLLEITVAGVDALKTTMLRRVSPKTVWPLYAAINPHRACSSRHQIVRTCSELLFVARRAARCHECQDYCRYQRPDL